MIFYYSATGNTRYAAKYIGEKLHDETINILLAGENYVLPDGNEPVGLMFPIYCWGIPPVVSRFIDKLFPQIALERYFWSACTCGDEAGTAMRGLTRNLKKHRGRGADAVWSVIMPNTYVLLPGFDVDKAEVEKEKLEMAPLRLDGIASLISDRASGICDVHEGSLPGFRSALFPVFKKWGVNTRWWHVSDSCIACGKCVSICPAKNIRLTAERPEWGQKCFSCCACYHCCPVKAISYSWFTKNKSQYLCPKRVIP